MILDRALRAVRRGEADVALGAFRQIPQGLAAAPLFEDVYVVIARKGHPHVDGAVDMATYALGGHIFVGDPDGALTDEAPVDRETMRRHLRRDARTGEVWTQGYVSQWETAMLLVATTNALADCPRSLARRYADRLGLQVLDPPFQPFRFTVQAVRRADVADPGLDWFMDRVAEAVAT